LQKLETEVAELRAKVRECEDALGALDFKRRRSSAVERAALQAEGDRLYAEQKGAEVQLANKSLELQEWRDYFGYRLFRLDELKAELLTAPAENFSMMTSDLGRKASRPRAETQRELLATLRELAGFSGDASAVAEYERAVQEWLDEEEVIITKRGYSWTSFDESTRELVLDTDVRGRVTAYGPGWKVAREEAARVGLLELEAQ
jgi:hypothetical protein